MRENFSEDEESLDDETEHETPVEVTPLPAPVNTGSKAWRSIERHRELRELRRHLDDFQFEEDPRYDPRHLPL
mgnify:CR=1 FL=1